MKGQRKKERKKSTLNQSPNDLLLPASYRCFLSWSLFSIEWCSLTEKKNNPILFISSCIQSAWQFLFLLSCLFFFIWFRFSSAIRPCRGGLSLAFDAFNVDWVRQWNGWGWRDGGGMKIVKGLKKSFLDFLSVHFGI